MLNFLRPFFQRLFRPLIQALARTPVTPNMITVAGTLGVAAASLGMMPIGWLFPGAATATVFIFTDMLDGQLARIKGDSGRYGAFLDSTMDRFGDAAIFGGIIIWFIRTNHLLAVVALFCLAGGLSVSYVKARAEGLGLNADVGLIERPERVTIALTAIGLSGLGLPYVLAIGMWGLAAGTVITLYQRMRAVYLDARAKDGPARPAPATAEPATAEPATAEPATAEPTAANQARADQARADQARTDQAGADAAEPPGPGPRPGPDLGPDPAAAARPKEA